MSNFLSVELAFLFNIPALTCTRLSLCQQFPDFIVGKHPVGFQPEYGQAAFRVVASYHLAEELHPARSALGTRAAGILFPEQLFARQQFGGDGRPIPVLYRPSLLPVFSGRR